MLTKSPKKLPSDLAATTESVLGGRHRRLLSQAYTDQLRTELKPGRLARLGIITIEFVFVVAVLSLSNVESQAFELIATISIVAFLIHHFLPANWRLAFFATLSVGSIPLIMGWGIGLWLLGTGVALIAICHLRINAWLKIAIVLLVGGILAAERLQLIPWNSPVPSVIWPIIGAMFMFRIIIYIYDLSHGGVPFSPARALAYFFMMPNVCFTLFPVIDYKTMQRSAYNDDALRLYQTGVKWMLRGVIQLILYKAVYFIAVVDPGDVADGLGAGRYMLSTFLLYLKISGLFHLIVGLLHMYGFGLAETHHVYLLSSSFTDFWRRINIYWKDFIQKIVFNPTYFSARRLGDTTGVVVATLIAFGATWLLHSYQWFWIRGEFPIVWSDLVFWFGLGLVVMVNVLIELRRGRQRALGPQVTTWHDDAALVLKTAGTFAAVCVLWTIWSTPQIAELKLVGNALLNSGPLDVVVLLGVPVGIGFVGVLMRHRKREVFGAGTEPGVATKALLPQAGVILGTSTVLIFLCLRPEVVYPLSPTVAGLIEDMRKRETLNAGDSKKLVRGYYEDLGDVARISDELRTILEIRPDGWAVSMNSMTVKTKNGMGREFIPSTAQISMGVMRTINRLGLRDREYARLPGANVFRIALVGSSHDVGVGIGDRETYENLVEDHLNQALSPVTGLKYEILNFSMQAYRPTQKLAVIRAKALEVQPDLILYVATSNEFDWTFRNLRDLAENQLLSEFYFIKEAMDRGGVGEDDFLMDEEALSRQLAPQAEKTLRDLFLTFREETESRGVRAGVVLLEVPHDDGSSDSLGRLKSLAQSSGIPVLDLRGTFENVGDHRAYWITPWDDHTNAQGHRLIAERLYAALVAGDFLPTETRNGLEKVPSTP